jgi:hypothetical protein
MTNHLVRRSASPLRALRVYFALQIPFISSPLIAYRFSTGFQTTIAIVQSRFAVDWRLGSEGQFALFSSAPWGVGLNIVALVIVLLLYSRLVAPEHSSVQRPNQTLERTADRREDLLAMTSTLKREAKLALVSGRSAYSR